MIRHVVSGAALCFALSACGGGNGASPVPRVPNASARVTLLINVPPKTAAAGRRPLYVSSATQSMSISINGGTAVTANLTPASPNCTSSGPVLTCTVAVDAPVGNDTFAVTLFDGQSGAGNALSRATVPATIVAGQNNTVSMTLNGIVASIVLSFASAPAPIQGSPATFPLSVAAKDAAGSTIIGDPYDSPITLSGTDTSGAARLSATTVSSPSDAVNVVYNGAVIPSVTFSAAASGVVPANVRSAVLPPPKTPHTVDWPTFNIDSQRSGFNASEGTLGRTNAAGLHQLWSFSLDAPFTDTQPTVATNVLVNGIYIDLVFVGDEHAGFYAINAATGARVWKRQLVSNNDALTHPAQPCDDIPDKIFGVTGTPAIERARNRIYVADAKSLYALDMSTGAAASGWPAQGVTVVTDPTQDHVYSAVTLDIANARAYVTTASFCDYTPGPGGARAVSTDSATVVAGPLYLVPPAPNVFGGGIWGPGGLSIDPRSSATLYAGVGSKTGFASGIANAIIRLTSDLSYPSSTSVNTPPATIGDADFGSSPLVYQDGGSSCLAAEQKSGILYTYSLDAIGSGPVESLKIGAGAVNGVDLGTPAHANHMVFVQNATNGTAPFMHGLLAFNVLPGCHLGLAWQTSIGATSNGTFIAPYSPPIVANGVVYVTDGLGKTLYAIDAQSGAILWRFVAAGAMFIAPTVANGELFATSWDFSGRGHLYAFGP